MKARLMRSWGLATALVAAFAAAPSPSAPSRRAPRAPAVALAGSWYPRAAPTSSRGRTS